MIPVIDMHCDTIAEIYAAEERGDRSLGLRKNGLMMDLERMKEGGYMCQSFALFSHMGRLREAGKDPFDHVCALSRTFDEQMAANSDLISPVTTGSQIEDNMHKGLMSALKTVEEGAVYEGSIEKLECLYDMGVRKSTLTWNFENELAYPNRSVHDPRKGTTTCSGIDKENGLKQAGFDFVLAMEDMGMLIDISHLNDAGIMDIFNTVRSDTPVIASHSNARGVCMHPRNLSDEMLLKIAEHGGVTGINYCATFLDESNQHSDRELSRVEDMIRHMKYIRNLAGMDIIGLGSDFDGIGGELELAGAQDMQKLADAMSLVGFTTDEIEKVFYKNVLRVYKQVLG